MGRAANTGGQGTGSLPLDGVRVLYYGLSDYSTRLREYKEAIALTQAGATVCFMGYGSEVPAHLQGGPAQMVLMERLENAMVPKVASSLLATISTYLWHKPRRWWWRAVGRWSGIYRLADEFAPTVVHAVDTVGLWGAHKIAAHCHAPLVYDAHEYWRGFISNPAMAVNPRWNRRVLLSEQRLIRRASLVLTTSDEMSAALERDYGPLPTTTLNNSLPLPAAPADPAAHDPLRLVFHGQVGLDRNIRGVIRGLAAAGGRATLDVYGAVHPEVREAVEETIRSVGLGRRVTLHGRFDYRDLPALLRQYDVEIYAGREADGNVHVTLPNKIFDAIVCGLAVIMPPFAPMIRVVGETGAGIVLESSSDEDIARAIAALEADPALVERYKAAARAAAPHLCWEAQGTKLVAAYAAMLGRNVEATDGGAA